jgi:hypothetical protein
MSALFNVDSSAIAFIGVIGWTFSTPFADGFGTIAGRPFSKPIARADFTNVFQRGVCTLFNQIALTQMQLVSCDKNAVRRNPICQLHSVK